MSFMSQGQVQSGKDESRNYEDKPFRLKKIMTNVNVSGRQRQQQRQPDSNKSLKVF
jgi:hypothetical protein